MADTKDFGRLPAFSMTSLLSIPSFFFPSLFVADARFEKGHLRSVWPTHSPFPLFFPFLLRGHRKVGEKLTTSYKGRSARQIRENCREHSEFLIVFVNSFIEFLLICTSEFCYISLSDFSAANIMDDLLVANLIGTAIRVSPSIPHLRPY